MPIGRNFRSERACRDVHINYADRRNQTKMVKVMNVFFHILLLKIIFWNLFQRFCGLFLDINCIGDGHYGQKYGGYVEGEGVVGVENGKGIDKTMGKDTRDGEPDF